MTVRRVGVTAPLGFMAAGVHCGIKKSFEFFGPWH